MIEAVILMLALPVGALLVAGAAVALVGAIEFASLMLFLLLVTSGPKAGRL